MRKNLKSQVFAVTLFFIVVFTVAGLISIVEFRYISNSIHRLIQDNYRSIKASKTMLDALEREDSGILLLLLGEWAESGKILETADSTFLIAFSVAKNNLTEKDEDKYVKKIEESYAVFKEKWEKQIAVNNREGDINWYKNDIHQAFVDTKKAVTSLMDLNQESLYNRVSTLKEKSGKAIMPGVVSIIAALVFSFLLNYFVARHFAP